MSFHCARGIRANLLHDHPRDTSMARCPPPQLSTTVTTTITTTTDATLISYAQRSRKDLFQWYNAFIFTYHFNHHRRRRQRQEPHIDCSASDSFEYVIPFDSFWSISSAHSAFRCARLDMWKVLTQAGTFRFTCVCMFMCMCVKLFPQLCESYTYQRKHNHKSRAASVDRPS